jgi:Zn-dependent protease with chaperone function
MVIPWLMMWGLFDIGRAVYSSLWGAESFESFVLENSLSGFISIIMLACVAIFFPLILVKLWQCKPLKDEGLKSKLEALEEKTGITFSKIYVWNLGGSSFLNAAVMGMVKPFRFLLISKGILEHLTKDEICGVVAHEMGHVKHKHIISYFVITTAFVCIISYLLQMFDFDPKISAFLICLGMAVYIRIVFAYISRNFERQADLFGIEAMGTAEPLINSLEKIGFYSGNIRSSKSWHHGSIAERVDFLRNAEYDRLLRFMHHRHCTKIKAAGYIISISTLIFFLASPSPVPDEVHNALLTRNNLASYSTDEILKHWRRVSKLIKNDFESYAKMSEIEIKRNHYIPKQKADKIERWLDTAINNAQTTKQRMRVLDLLQQLEEKRNFLQKSSPAINI